MFKHLIVISFIWVFLFSPLSTFGQGILLPDPGTLPDSPFYFLKSWKENIQLFFTFGAEKKAEQYLHLAEVRLAEYEKMIEKGKQEVAERTLSKYEDQLNRALAKAEELKARGEEKADEVRTKIEEATSKHIQVLEENLTKVPEAAKEGLEKVIEASRKGIEKTREAIERKPAVPGEEQPSVIPPDSQPSITVLSPNGGEKWEIGKTHDIIWKGRSATLNLYVLDYNRCAYVGAPPICITPSTAFSTNVSNLGKYSWKIPADLLGGDKYKISLEDGHIIYDESDNFFSIVSSATTQPSITVLSPNGGEIWKVGIPYQITWKASGLDTVDILINDYENQDTANLTHAVGVSASNGAFSYTPTANFTGSKMKIHILGVDKNGVNINDDSDGFFSINP